MQFSMSLNDGNKEVLGTKCPIVGMPNVLELGDGRTWKKGWKKLHCYYSKIIFTYKNDFLFRT